MRIRTSIIFLAVLCGCGSPALMGRTGRTSFIETKLLETKEKGIELYERGEPEKALEKFKEALRIARSVDDRKEEAANLINIGRVLLVLERPAEAEDFLGEAVSAAEMLGDGPVLSEAYATLAKGSYMTGDLNAALDSIEEAISIDARLGVRHGSRLNIKGLIYTRAGRLDEAEALLREALKRNLGDSLETANSLRALAVLAAMRYSDAEALELFRSAYEIDRTLGDPGRIAYDLNAMAELHTKSGELAEAAYLFERSYIVNLNSARTSAALRNLESLIATYGELGDEKKVLYYTSMKEGMLSGSGKTKDPHR